MCRLRVGFIGCVLHLVLIMFSSSVWSQSGSDSAYVVESVNYTNFGFADKQDTFDSPLSSDPVTFLNIDRIQYKSFGYSYFVQNQAVPPDSNTFFMNGLFTVSVGADGVGGDGSTIFEQGEGDDLLEPLVYPSPFRFSDGAHLGFELPTDMAIEVRIYNIAGHELYKRSFPAGTPLRSQGHQNHTIYNKIPITPIDFNGVELPSGVYFFVIIHNNDVWAKGKFAIRP